ncbi:hypothetical protein [Streptomyces sp. TRM70350]|uniref:hypothetical protein n=1 Tax=Streptomyces sp. TRM70350 TaxID=2856165 RepID=UPI001C450D32|nr:hypothetical protein [Streptomyces sp. TRM70350]MBV7699006.1 hypothetical protein [Streptomyces sp. TRM70350]
MKRAYVAACAVAVVVSTALTGCTPDTDDTAAAATRQREAPRSLTHAQEVRLKDAEQLLVKRCMTRQGFTYHEHRPMTLEELRPVGYVQDDIAWAREHGYGSRIADKGNRARRDNPNIAHRASLSDKEGRAYDTALNGGASGPTVSAEVPGSGRISKRVGGCVGEAEQQLYGDLETWFGADKTASGVRALAEAEVMDDPRFTAAVERWARCMKRSGHPYTDPGLAREAVQRRSGRLPDAEAFEVERTTAVADATCARQVSLRSVAEERQAHHLAGLLDEHGEYGDALDTIARIQRDALDRAERIVGPRT